MTDMTLFDVIVASLVGLVGGLVGWYLMEMLVDELFPRPRA